MAAVPDLHIELAAGFSSQYSLARREYTCMMLAHASIMPKIAATVQMKIDMTKIRIFFLLQRVRPVESVGLNT